MAQPDWHQTRFLFVKSIPKGSAAPAPAQTRPSAPRLEAHLYFKQDPERPALGPDHAPVNIPLSSLPPRLSGHDGPGSGHTDLQDDDIAVESSDDEDIEDVEFLFSDDDDLPSVKGKGKVKTYSEGSSLDNVLAQDT